MATEVRIRRDLHGTQPVWRWHTTSLEALNDAESGFYKSDIRGFKFEEWVR